MYISSIIYGLTISDVQGTICLRADQDKKGRHLMSDFKDWYKQRKRYENGEITKEEYDEWRYTFPPIEAQRYDDIRAYYGIRKLSERGPDPFEGAEDIDLD